MSERQEDVDILVQRWIGFCASHGYIQICNNMTSDLSFLINCKLHKLGILRGS
jgi:hypothetical protein